MNDKPAFNDFDARGKRDAPGAMPKWEQFRVAWQVADGVQERIFDDMKTALTWCKIKREAGVNVAVFRQHVKECLFGTYRAKETPAVALSDAEPILTVIEATPVCPRCFNRRIETVRIVSHGVDAMHSRPCKLCSAREI